MHYQGRPVQKLRRSWDSVCKRAGVGDDVVPHTCRHTAATWQMQAVTDHFEAAGYLGMSIDMLVRVYGHQHPLFQATAAPAAPGVTGYARVERSEPRDLILMVHVASLPILLKHLDGCERRQNRGPVLPTNSAAIRRIAPRPWRGLLGNTRL
jgi:hypothetical protein